MGSPSKLIEVVRKAAVDLFTDVKNGIVPASGGGTTNFLRADGVWTNPGASATDIKVTEQDFGSVPTSYGQWTVSDGAVGVSSQVFVALSAEAPAALRDGVAADGDEADMEPMDCVAQSIAVGSFLLTAEARDGPVTGPYKFYYLLG